MQQYSVCLSVPSIDHSSSMMAGFAAGFPMGKQDIDHPIIRPLHAAAAGLLLWAQ